MSLEEENKRLKIKNRELEEKTRKLSQELAKAKDRIQYLQQKCRPVFVRLTPNSFSFQSNPKPKMTIKCGNNRNIVISFESSNDAASVLAQAICERPERIRKMLNEPVSLEDFYKWVGRGDWFNATKEERNQFKQDIYQWFRRLNDKISSQCDGKKIFQNVNGGYMILSTI